MSFHSIVRRLAPLASTLALAVGLAACGQKGPLYLPDGDRPVKVEPAPADAAAGNTPDLSHSPRKQIH